MPGSHFYVCSIIAEALVQRGHKVTFVISDVFGDRANSNLAKVFDSKVFSSTISKSQMREKWAAF